MRIVSLGLIIIGAAVSAVPVGAADLGKSMMEAPKFDQISQKQLAEIERCIILGDYSDIPVAYRSPEKPDESLVYYTTTMGSPPVIRLDRTESGVRVRVWQGAN